MVNSKGVYYDISYGQTKTKLIKYLKIYDVKKLIDIENAVKNDCMRRDKICSDSMLVLVNDKSLISELSDEGIDNNWQFSDTFVYFKGRLYTTEVGTVLHDFDILRIKNNDKEIEVFYKPL